MTLLDAVRAEWARSWAALDAFGPLAPLVATALVLLVSWALYILVDAVRRPPDLWQEERPESLAMLLAILSGMSGVLWMTAAFLAMKPDWPAVAFCGAAGALTLSCSVMSYRRLGALVALGARGATSVEDEEKATAERAPTSTRRGAGGERPCRKRG